MNGSVGKIKIAGIVTKSNMDQVLHLLQQPSPSLHHCSVLEFRADTFLLEELESFWELFFKNLSNQKVPIQSILTFRLPQDGGQWKGSLSERNSWISKLISIHPCDYIDLEIQNGSQVSPEMLSNWKKLSRLLCSYHQFEGPILLSQLQNIYTSMQAFFPAAFKFALYCHSFEDFSSLVDFSLEVRATSQESSVMAMGEYGKISRILTPLWGCSLTYGYIGGEAVVPGQWEVNQLSQVYEKMERRYISYSPHELIKLIETGELTAETLLP